MNRLLFAGVMLLGGLGLMQPAVSAGADGKDGKKANQVFTNTLHGGKLSVILPAGWSECRTEGSGDSLKLAWSDGKSYIRLDATPFIEGEKASLTFTKWPEKGFGMTNGAPDSVYSAERTVAEGTVRKVGQRQFSVLLVTPSANAESDAAAKKFLKQVLDDLDVSKPLK
jgi:hypothetical protein